MLHLLEIGLELPLAEFCEGVGLSAAAEEAN